MYSVALAKGPVISTSYSASITRANRHCATALLSGCIDAAWDGPVLGGHRAVGVRALLDGRDGGVLRTTEVASGPGWAVLPLALGGCAITAVGVDLLAMRSSLATANERLCDQRHSNAPVSSLDVP